jgi:hypothetical protein
LKILQENETPSVSFIKQQMHCYKIKSGAMLSPDFQKQFQFISLIINLQAFYKYAFVHPTLSEEGKENKEK